MMLAPDTAQQAIYLESVRAPTCAPATPSCSPTGSISASASSTLPKASTSSWWRPKVPGTSCGGPMRVEAASPVSWPSTATPVERPRLWGSRTPGPSGPPGRRPGDDVQRGDRDRPVRRAGRAVRWPDLVDQGRFRHSGRGGLPARVGLFRMPPRGEAHRGPHLRARDYRHALFDIDHSRVRRHDPRPG